LMQQHAPSLRMLVNREGFVPDAAYDSLVTVVRTGIDLMTRVRATVTAKERYSRRQERAKRSLSKDASGSPSIVETLVEAERHAAAARRHAAAGEGESATLQLDLALARIKNIADASDELIDQAAMLRVLASLGTQLSSFVHELNGLLGMAETIEKALQKVVEGTEDLDRRQRGQ
jgi:hypothetical protein